MTLFLIGIVMLVVGYFTYGRLVEKIVQPDDRETPAFTKADGIDYVALPKWKNMLIQLLNIAGVGPVVGAILGIKFGPMVFLVIPIGNILGGAVHDYVSGMFSMRHGGSSLTTQMEKMMLPGMNRLMAVFMMVLLLLCVAVFINVPAHLTVEIPKVASEAAQVPAEAAQTPADAAQTPAVEAAQVPSDVAQVPAEVAQVPSDAAQTPVDAAQVPSDVAQTPAVEAAQVPSDAAQVPAEAALTPSDAAQTPVDAAQTPVEAALTPSDAAQVPSDAAQTSAEAPKTPVGETDHFALWCVIGAIFLYYIAATLFPVDKIIGKIYPFFGGMLLIGTLFLGISLVYNWFYNWFTGAEDFLSMTQAMTEAVPKQGPFIPCFFVTMACGVLSGFHGTQSPIVARTMKSEREARSTFYGMMVMEGVIAMIWAAGAMAMYHLQPDLLTINANSVLVKIAQGFLGNQIGVLTIVAVIILAVTTGDTAMRSMRLSLAEMVHLSQKSIFSRLLLSLPLIVIIAGLLIWSNRDAQAFNILWNYFAWGNQVLAATTLLGCTVWLAARRRCYWCTLVPGVFMTFVVTSFILWAPHEFKLPQGFNLPQNVSYAAAAVIALGLGVMEVIRGHRMEGED